MVVVVVDGVVLQASKRHARRIQTTTRFGSLIYLISYYIISFVSQRVAGYKRAAGLELPTQ